MEYRQALVLVAERVDCVTTSITLLGKVEEEWVSGTSSRKNRVLEIFHSELIDVKVELSEISQYSLIYSEKNC